MHPPKPDLPFLPPCRHHKWMALYAMRNSLQISKYNCCHTCSTCSEFLVVACLGLPNTTLFDLTLLSTTLESRLWCALFGLTLLPLSSYPMFRWRMVSIFTLSSCFVSCVALVSGGLSIFETISTSSLDALKA